MQEEIFGPVLPVLEYEDLSQVIEGIRNHPKPLSLYLFSESSKVVKEVLKKPLPLEEDVLTILFIIWLRHVCPWWGRKQRR